MSTQFIENFYKFTLQFIAVRRIITVSSGGFTRKEQSMKSNKILCQFALYKGENDVYHSYYQNADGTFCRVTTDIKGKKTWINYFTVSEVGTQIYNAALLGYKW